MGIPAITKLLDRVHAVQDLAARHAALELMLAMMDLQYDILDRVMAILGKEWTDRLAADPLIRSVLTWHGLHPVDVPSRVLLALQRLEFQIGSVKFELVSSSSAAVRVRLHGDPCFRAAIATAITEVAPEVVDVEVEVAPTSAISCSVN
ncbi:MAG: hypothetical protein P4K98_05500 [Bryobacteraceae bacterium]|nr:hypothetical protein [Bryobacteraceae bacterium]